MIVVDASVVLKWLLNDPATEADTECAQEIMRKVIVNEQEVLQPPHWLAEVASVLSRISPGTVDRDVAMLHALELPVRDDPAIYQQACRLAVDLKQHVFDTLYHAVALESEAGVLVTADERYAKAASSHGRLIRLAAWSSVG